MCLALAHAGWKGTDYQPQVADPSDLKDRLAKMKVLDADARIFYVSFSCLHACRLYKPGMNMPACLTMLQLGNGPFPSASMLGLHAGCYIVVVLHHDTCLMS